MTQDELHKGLRMDGTYDAALGQKRQYSLEVDYGMHWKGEFSYPNYRASWIQNTGEFYLFNFGTAELQIIAVIKDREQLETRLTGWEKQCGQLRSLIWLKEKLCN